MAGLDVAETRGDNYPDRGPPSFEIIDDNITKRITPCLYDRLAYQPKAKRATFARRWEDSPLRIVVHDYAGHPFQVQLSRELARRRHQVLHLHFTELQTPKGDLELREDDPPTFRIEGINLGKPFRKGSIVRRWYQERLYAQRLARVVTLFCPDLVLSANTPLEVQLVLARACHEQGIRFVPWVQDFYSSAVATILVERWGSVLGGLAGVWHRRIERSILRACDQVVYITTDFVEQSAGWNIDSSKCHVIENWAPLDELPPRTHSNAWARRHGLLGKTVLMYSGTLGHKHNPRFLLELAEAFRADQHVAVACVAEGPGREWLEHARAARSLGNLLITGPQRYKELPDVLASGDVLIALLERDAGGFAVPSKVLSYMCARRALLLAVPRGNLAARTVADADAGLIVEPTDLAGFVNAARRLVLDPGMRAGLAANARRYAEATFRIGPIADRFEAVFRACFAPTTEGSAPGRPQTNGQT